jgi:ketosteroid isomerase-like protein
MKVSLLVTAAAVTLCCALALAQSVTPQPPPPPTDADLAQARRKIAAAAAASRARAKTDAEKAVVEADLAFAADAAKRGAMAAFGAVMHPQGHLFPPRAPITVGPAAARALFEGDTALWEWAPVAFQAEGSLGVTWGIAAISGRGEDGKPFLSTTRYVSVWRRDNNGTWKLWLDVGTPGPLPEVGE